MLPSEVIHCQEEDRKRSHEEIGALEDGKMPVWLSHPQTVERMGGQQNYARGRSRTTTVEPDQLDEKVAQVCRQLGIQFVRLYSRNSLMRTFIVQLPRTRIM